MTPEVEERFRRIEQNLATASENIETITQIALRTDARLDRAIRLAVREARAERRKRRELGGSISELAASHLQTQEALRDLKATVDRFIQSLERGGNGHR